MSHQASVERFAAGGTALAGAIKGLSREDLLAFPVPGTWSIQQIVVHTLDSDLVASHRMKRIIAEERPLLIAYDETAFARSLHYEAEDLTVACELFRLNRVQMAGILRRLPDSAFERVAIHNQNGKMTLGGVVEGYVAHLEHHLRFMREKRALLGKPLAG